MILRHPFPAGFKLLVFLNAAFSGSPGQVHGNRKRLKRPALHPFSHFWTSLPAEILSRPFSSFCGI
jgi:hypothetical protein